MSPIKYATLARPSPRDIARFWDGYEEGRYDTEYLSTGRMDVYFKINSVREADYVFKVFRYPLTRSWDSERSDQGTTGIDSGWELNESPPVRIEDADAPGKVRVLPAKDEPSRRTMRFMWSCGARCASCGPPATRSARRR